MFSSRYQRKLTSEADSRACFICYKPTRTVLLNQVPSADFFYVCEAHLKDKGFAQLDEAPIEHRILTDDIAQLKKDWDANRAPPIPARADEAAKPADTKDSPQPAAEPVEEAKESPPAKPAGPQWYTINAQMHKLRLQHKARLAKQRKAQEILRSPLPSAPSHAPI